MNAMEKVIVAAKEAAKKNMVIRFDNCTVYIINEAVAVNRVDAVSAFRSQFIQVDTDGKVSDIEDIIWKFDEELPESMDYNFDDPESWEFPKGVKTHEAGDWDFEKVLEDISRII